MLLNMDANLSYFSLHSHFSPTLKYLLPTDPSHEFHRHRFFHYSWLRNTYKRTKRMLLFIFGTISICLNVGHFKYLLCDLKIYLLDILNCNSFRSTSLPYRLFGYYSIQNKTIIIYFSILYATVQSSKPLILHREPRPLMHTEERI